jgi:hypothetical protein
MNSFSPFDQMTEDAPQREYPDARRIPAANTGFDYDTINCSH